ncbi:zinc finger protein 541 [Grus japonensis]|uniref:Zinc finger protein 541 n=1 Tax=Grus japonensis TaxID=30415 RepID=A0ABC9XXY2_GRUJA
MYAGLSGSDVADAASHALQADLNGLSLSPVRDCGSVWLLDGSDLRHGVRPVPLLLMAAALKAAFSTRTAVSRFTPRTVWRAASVFVVNNGIRYKGRRNNRRDWKEWFAEGTPGTLAGVCGEVGDADAQRLWLGAAGDGNRPSEPEAPLHDVTVAPLVIPVSVPVTDSRGGNEVSPDEKDLKETSHQKKRKKQTRPKSLLIPPPPGPDAQPGVGGCYQSNLRSPVFLVDHLLRDLFQRSSYTPPPMLSPVREGSGLYFSTLCSPSASGDPSQLFGAVLGRMDKDFGFCLTKDNANISVQPHINVGSRFQAERFDFLSVFFALAVTELLNVACSSVMPGGGTNLELALHCLHEARGNVLEALEMLLFGAPQKSESHPLANYHYAGSDSWTPLEKQLFKKAFCLHKKDFYLIQKKIQTKSVSQCVEYYYIWKKKPKFDYSRAQVIEKKVKRAKDEVEETEKKAVCSPKRRRRFLPKESMKIKRKSYTRVPRGEGDPPYHPSASPDRAGIAAHRGVFPCPECER